jgi:hypothetical protein
MAAILIFRHHDETEKLSVEISDTTLWEVHHKDFLLIHHLSEIESRFRLTDDISHRGIGDEWSKFCWEKWNHFLFFSITCLCIFMIPESFYHDVLNFGCFVLHEAFIDKESWNIDECSAFVFIIHKGETTISEIVLYSWTKYFITIHFDKYRSGIECGTIFFDRTKILVCGYEIEHIETHRALIVCWIKYDHVFRSFFWSKSHDIFHKITMWIDHTESFIVPEILTGKISDKYWFTSPWFTDNIVMSSSILLREIYRLLIVSILIPSHQYTILIERESLELTMFIDLYRSLSFIERLSDAFSFFCYRNNRTIKKDKIFFCISQEILIFIDLKNWSIVGIDISTRIALIVFHEWEDPWEIWDLKEERASYTRATKSRVIYCSWYLESDRSSRVHRKKNDWYRLKISQ